MSTPYPTQDDEIKVFGSLAGAERYVPRAQNQDGTVIAGFNVGSSKFKSHEEYVARVQAMFDDNIPGPNKIRGTFGMTKSHVRKKKNPELVNGSAVYLDYTSMDMKDINNSLSQFSKMKKEDKSGLFFFDIETIGASTTRGKKGGLDNYSLSEFSVVNYEKSGKVNKANSLNLLMRMDENTKDKVVELLNKVGKDRYKFNSLNSSEQRQLIDLMRYSKVTEAGYSSFSNSQNGLIGKFGNKAIYNMDVTHNSLIEERYTDKLGKVDYNRIVQEWDKAVVHMQSGLKTLTSKDLTSQTDGAQAIEKFLKDNQKGTFVSYNGYEFDKPLLKDFIVKEAMNRENIERKVQGKDPMSYEQSVKEREKFFGRTSKVMDNHLDLYRLIESVYGSVGELEKSMTGKNDHTLANKQLQTLREFLPEKMKKELEKIGSAHNAEADNHVLAKLYEHLHDDMNERIKKGYKNPAQIQQVDSRNFSKGPEKLKFGMQLVSNRALVTDDKWDPYSFVQEGKIETDENGNIKLDEKGKPITSYGLADESRGRVILRRESLYEFRGIEQIKNLDGSPAFRAQFYNVLEDEHAYVVRTGHNAEAELASFINDQFSSAKYAGYDRFGDKSNKNSLYKMTKEQIADDRATRYYSSMFAPDNFSGGLWMDKETGELRQSTSKGINSLKLNMQASEVYQKFLAEKEANVTGFNSKTGQYEYADGYDRKKAGKEVRTQIQQIFKNEKHSEHFFRLRGRLSDEMPLYQQAVESIDKQYAGEVARLHTEALEEVYERQGGDRTWHGEASYKLLNKDYIYNLRDIQQKQNLALSLFHQQVEQLMENNEEAFKNNKRDVRRLNERWEVKLTDPQRDANITINFANYNEAKMKMLSYMKKTTYANEAKLPGIRRERYAELINSLNAQGILSPDDYRDLRKFGSNTPNVSGTTYANAIFDAVTKQQQKKIRAVEKENPGMSYEERMQKAFEGSSMERVTTQKALNLESNRELGKFLTSDVQKQFIDNAIERSENFMPSFNYMVAGDNNTKKIELPSAMRDYLSTLDRKRSSSILQANNVDAVEKVLTKMQQTFGSKYSIFLSMEQDSQGNYKGVNFMATEMERGSSALNTLNRGETPTNMMKFTMPLIDEAGFMRAGNLNMNANMIADLQTINGKKQAVLISTQDAIADILVQKMGQARKDIENKDLITPSSGYEKASDFMNNRVKEYLSTLSGSDKQSNMQVGDTAKVQGNLMDWRKQQHVLFEDAYVKDLLDRGFGNFKLNDDDLRRSAFSWNSEGLRQRKDYLSINDLHEEAKMKALNMRSSWWEANRSMDYDNVFLTLGSVKSSNADKFLSALDNQAYMPLGMLHDTVRDPMSQAFGAEILDDGIRNKIRGIRGVQTELSYMSANQFDLAKTFAGAQGELMIPDMVQIKTAYMTNTDILNRVGSLMEDEYARSVFTKNKLLELIDQAEVDKIKLNIQSNARQKGTNLQNLTEEQKLWQEGFVKKVGNDYYKVDMLRLPNTYEQQSAVDQEFLDAMKLKNSRRYASNHTISFNEGFDENSILKAGEKFGKITFANGVIQDMEYNGKGTGTIGEVIKNKDGTIRELKTFWEEDAFKAFTLAEKSTMQGVNREVIKLITGNDDVVMIHAGEVYKHKEHGHFLARLQAELSMDIKGSAGDERALKIKTIEDAKLGLRWDEKHNVLIDETYVKPKGYAGGQNEYSLIKRGGDSAEYSKAMANLVEKKDENGNYIFKGFEKKFSEEISTGIEQFRLAKIVNSAKAVDEDGAKFLGYTEHFDEELGKTVSRPVYSDQVKDGVTIGHREIRTMRSQGMVETMGYIQQKMLSKTQENKLMLSGINDIENYSGIGYNHRITLAQELDNMVSSIEMAVDSGARADEFAISRRVQDFAQSLPTRNYDPNMYHHTIFDMNTILEESLQEKALVKGKQLYGEDFNQESKDFFKTYNEVKVAHETADINSSDRVRGFWLELPTATNGTETISPILSDRSKFANATGVRGERKMADKEVNKIFVPLMHASQDKGNRYLNEIQRHVRAIVERAEQATSAESFEARSGHIRELSGMISNYYSTIVEEVSSSKGYVNKNMNRYAAENSASGLYKLLDSQQTNAFQNQFDYKGEFTVMHEDDARAMGLSDQEIKDLRNPNSKKEMYVGQVRYPSFHDGAVQYNRLFIGEEGQVRKGEFRTSTFSSMLKNADSDGDNSYMFMIRDQKVQSEMKGFQEKRIVKYQDAFEKYMGEKGKSDEMVRNMRMQGGDHISSLLGDKILEVRGANTSQEVVAKVWKGIVGQVSNLNYDMQQLASDMLERGEIGQNEYAKTIKFGQLLEQKIIDSKHGAEGVSSQIISSIKNGNWTQAETLMRQHYGAIDKATGEAKKLSIHDKNGALIKTVNMSEFDADNAFDTARQVVLRATTHYQTEQGKINIVGLDYGKSSGFLGTLEQFAEISRNTEFANSAGMMSRHNTYLNLMHGHLGINQEALKTSAQMQADAMAANITKGPITINGMSASIASEQERKLLQSVSANPIMDLIDPSAAAGVGRSKMLAGAGLAVGALVGYNMLIGNSKPPQYDHGGSQQFKRQYTEEQIYGEPSTGAATQQGMMAEPSEFDYRDRQFENHQAESGAVGRAEKYAQQQFANVMISAKGMSRVDDSIAGLVNDAMVNSGMVTGAANIQLSTSDNTRSLNRIWYRDTVENNAQ